MTEPLLFVGCRPVFRGNNTFRRGLKWATAVKIGDVIPLAEAHSKKVFGNAKVTGIVTGPLGVLLDWCANSNHAVTDTDELVEDAGDFLWGVLGDIYGKDIALSEDFTVLYLASV